MIDFTRPADLVAPELLGGVISHRGVSVRLTEVEAYLGAEDAAAHTYRGMTPRNAANFTMTISNSLEGIGAVLFNAFAYFLIKPTYQSTAKLYVVSASDDSIVNLQDLNIGSSLTKDYEDLILSYPWLIYTFELPNQAKLIEEALIRFKDQFGRPLPQEDNFTVDLDGAWIPALTVDPTWLDA